MRRRAALHLCEVHGDHFDVPAVGYFECTTFLGVVEFLWACDACRSWWRDRHQDHWTPLPEVQAGA